MTTKQAVLGIREQNGELNTNTTWTAWIFGVDERALGYWVEKGAPKVERGWWNPRELNAWLGKNGAAANGEETYDEARKLRADILYREEKVKTAEIERKALEGEYLAKEEVEREWVLRILEVKSVLLGLAGALASQFTDAETRAEVRRVVDNEIYRALEQYSREGRYTPRGNDTVETEREVSMETPGEANV